MKVFIAIILSILIVVSAGCYSFTGASVPSHLKTVAIPLMEDQTGLGEPSLRERMTRTLTDLFIRDNSLEVADKSAADSILDGVIVSARDEIVSVGGGETVNKRRINMSVQVVYQDMKLRKRIYEKTFSNYGDYDPTAGFTQRQAAFDEAIRKISEDILLETVSGW
ncbi:MAG: LptE family protein [bacterium]